MTGTRATSAVVAIMASDRQRPKALLPGFNKLMGTPWRGWPVRYHFYQDDHAAVGHCRLSIIDLAGGHQPMANEDASVDRL
jgi:hypothetical protein